MHLYLVLLLCLWSVGIIEAFSPQKRPITRVVRDNISPPILTGLQGDKDNLSLSKQQDSLLTNQQLETEQEEYHRKLAEAQVAIAAAEEARRKLQKSSSLPSSLTPPPESRVKLSRTDAGSLMIELPPTGFNAASLFSGAFSIAWFSAIIPATFSGLWLFMLPFWMAGGMVAKQAVVDPFVSAQLTIGQYAWSLKSIYGGDNGIVMKEKEGATEDLRAARPELAAVVNGIPQYEIKLYGTKEASSLQVGPHISEEELEYLADEINDYLRQVHDNPEVLLPPSSSSSS